MTWVKRHLAELLLTIIIFMPRLVGLNVFLTPDEPLFLEHAQQVAAAFTTGDFNQTVGIGYPGITVAGLVAPFVAGKPGNMAAYAAGRVPVALLTGLLLLLLYALARRLLGRWPAFIGVALLALDPYTLAYSRLLHIEAPLALLMTLAGVAWLLWLRDANRRWLLLTGLLTGLALLTKSTALLLGPMLAAAAAGWAVSTGRWRSGRWWLTVVAGVAAVALLAAVVFFLLWPAMWVDPRNALNLTFGKLLTDQEAGTGNLGMFWLGHFVQDPGPVFYPVAFLLKSTPWLLFGLSLSLIQLTQEVRTRGGEDAKIIASSPHRLIAPSLWLFALTYLILMTIASKKSIRYLLPAFPTFYLLTGLAFHQLAQRLRQNQPFNKMLNNSYALRTIYHSPNSPPSQLPNSPTPNSLLPTPYSLLLLLSLSLSLTLTLFYHPYYFTYTNPLLLGWRWAPQALLIGWGEGLDEAARYLNEHHPTATVSAWYEWLFPLLYDGPVESVVPPENLITADYAVLYINQVQRDIPNPNIIHYFRTRRTPEHTVRLKGIDYAWVYPGPIAGFRPDPATQFSLGGEFAGEARLLGYNLSPQPVSGSQPLLVTLFWRVLTPPATERFVFLRLVDEQGRIWASSDGPPIMGLWPVARWQPDMVLEDAHELSIPPGTPPGLYRLEVGLYDTAQPGQPRTLAATGQPVGAGGGLLLGQVEVQWRPLQADTMLPQQTNTLLAPNAKLVGYTAPIRTATTGDSININLDWQEAATFFSDWWQSIPNNWVMFEWRQNGRAVAEQLEPLPLSIDHWGRKALLRSQYTLIVPPTLASGQYELVVMLHTSSDPAGDAFPLGMVDVTAPPHQFDLPPAATYLADPIRLTAEANQTITTPAYQLLTSGQGLDLVLYWQADAPITTPYKVFAQLLNSNGELLLQSDLVPGGGERPVTSWLPGEVVLDAHPLYPQNTGTIPPGTYRLIVGMYNPMNGQRLPVLNAASEVIGDAATITEVTLP